MITTLGVEEIVRFLRRFSDLMSTGHNADHLLRAANLIEALIKHAKDAEELLQQEQIKSEKTLQSHRSAEVTRAGLEEEMAELKGKLAEQQWKLNETIANAAAEEQRLSDRVKQAEDQLAAIESELAEAPLGTFADGHVLVPISTLRHAEAQFETLARDAADIVSRAMCEAGASTLDRVILESAAKSSAKASRQAA